jgi:zinc-ribbon domain
MAGFCKNCGSPLADNQAFCTKCGVAVGTAATARPAVPGLSPVSPMGTAPQKSNNSTLIRVLLICGAVVLVFGIAGVVGLVYVGRHFAHQMGLDDPRNMQYHGPVLGGADPCSLLSKEDVAEVVKLPVVRVEQMPGLHTGAGCVYSVTGSEEDLVDVHISMNKEQTTEAQRRQMEGIAQSAFRNPSGGSYNIPRHPGEAAVFIFNVDNNAAKMQMGMMHVVFSRMPQASITVLPGTGDDAFDLFDTMIMARKGDTVAHVVYMACPCTRDDAVSLVKKIVDGIPGPGQ